MDSVTTSDYAAAQRVIPPETALAIHRPVPAASGAEPPRRISYAAPDFRVFSVIAAVYVVVTFFAGLSTHIIGGFGLNAALTQSAINVFSGICVLFLGACCISSFSGEGGLSRSQWAVTIGLMVSLHAIVHVIIYNYIKLDAESFSRGGLPYLAITFFCRGAAILCAVMIYDFYLRKKRVIAKTEESYALAVAYRDSEISRLRAQLSPHFLFNSLGAIASEAERPQMVEKLVACLADVLRYNMSHTSARAPLGEEEAAVRSYLRMEKSRLGDALVVDINISAAARAVWVPHPLFFPLVENAIKYGRETSGAVLKINIGAEVRGDRLTLWVENSGQWVKPGPAESGRQVGLSNLKRRLDLQIGPGDYVRIEPLLESVRVSIGIPWA